MVCAFLGIKGHDVTMDITDAFDEISGWEEQLIAEGEELGFTHGHRLGVEEGRELGVIKGMEIGSEIGFYHGCYYAWRHIINDSSSEVRISDRAAKSIESFGALVTSFELKNVVDDDILHKLLTIRAKFKVISALLGVKNSLVFNPDDAHAHKNMSF